MSGKSLRSNIIAKILLAALTVGSLGLTGCGGSDGKDGKNGAPGPAGPPGPPGSGETAELNLTITSVAINGAPVVRFTATNQNGSPVTGLSASSLGFTIAKLIPANAGNPTQWQNYIVTTQTATVGPGTGRTAVQGTRDSGGTLVNNADGSYTYTFGTNITNVSCPAPCRDAFGHTLNLSYQPGYTHRVGMQTRGSLPSANATFDFVPNGSPITTRREIVKTAKCNECHDKIEAHDARIEVKYCVTCHNPGSVDPNSEDPTKDADTNLLLPAAVHASGAVDFKVMIHKIHRGEFLPSVTGPDGEYYDDPSTPGVDESADNGEYAIWGYRNTKHDFSTIVFPQDIRNCTKCHDGTDPDTTEGGNWSSVPSMEACGSCHDNVKFGVVGPWSGNPDPSLDVNGHPGGVQTDNMLCAGCHGQGGLPAVTTAETHVVPGKAERAFFKFNILEICGTAVGANPVCPPTTNPTVKFSVTDPTGATTHGYGNAYNIRAGGDPEFNGPGGASLNILVGWDTRDYNNDGGTGDRPARANSVNVRSSTAVTPNGDGTYTLSGGLVTPNPFVVPAGAVGSGVIGMEGRGLAQDGGIYSIRVSVNSEVAYFRITDATVKPRRQVVDVPTKCDRCHDILTFHGGGRNNNGQLCVICHNPNNTDVAQRPKDLNGAPDPTATADGKREEAIDFKRLIHGIHAAARTNHDGTIAHGFRENGLVVYGFNGSEHDYSHTRFPGVLSKCETCHLPDTFKLMDRSAGGGGNWELPTQAGILSSTTDAAPTATDTTSLTTQAANQADDLNISPTAAVCSSCHDGTLAREHMIQIGGASFGALQGDINSRYETCAVCHGPGKIASVEFVHSEDFGEGIP